MAASLPRPATRLVCTLGPASAGLVPELVAAGMSIARLNLSHGDLEGHTAAVRAVRAAEQAAGRPIAILADLPGPKVRLGSLAAGAVDLVAGTSFDLRPGDDEPGDARGAGVSHRDLAGDLRPGDRVLLSDGAVELRVVACTGDRVETLVERGGRVRTRGGVGVPSERLSLPAVGDRDRDLARLAVSLGVDFVGQSFVRSPADVEHLRDVIGVDGPGIVAKIETRPAAEAVREILAVADAAMVARGDLGVELPFEEVPLAQLRIVTECRRAGRPVIVATQMLESMTDAPRPTRAEVSDVANAVLDGADAVMLSGETAIGRFPLEAALAAVRIASAAEAEATRPGGPDPGEETVPDARDALAVSIAGAAVAESDPDVHAILTWTRTGRTARLLATRRPRVPVYAITPDVSVARRLVLHRGMEPAVAQAGAPGPALDAAITRLRDSGRISEGDAVVLVASSAGTGTGPNVVEIRRVEPGEGGAR